MTPQEAISLYCQLAEEHKKQGHPQERDRFLLLAADAALTAGQGDRAERLRKNILGDNPSHLLKPYGSLAEALKSADILAYVQQLRRTYPPEKAEGLLQNLKVAGQGKGNSKPEEFLLDLDAEREPASFNFTLEGPQAQAKKPVSTVEARSMAERDEPQKPGSAPLWRPAVGSSSPETPNIFSVRPAEPAGPRSIAPLPLTPPSTLAADAEEPASGGWLGGLLAVVVVLAGLTLLVYTFGRPWLPLP